MKSHILGLVDFMNKRMNLKALVVYIKEKTLFCLLGSGEGNERCKMKEFHYWGHQHVIGLTLQANIMVQIHSASLKLWNKQNTDVHQFLHLGRALPLWHGPQMVHTILVMHLTPKHIIMVLLPLLIIKITQNNIKPHMKYQNRIIELLRYNNVLTLESLIQE